MKYRFEIFGEYWETIITFFKFLWSMKWIYKIRNVFKSVFDSEDVGCLLAPLRAALFLGLLMVSIGIAFFLLRHALKLAESIGQYTF